jgi:hypothetical protein
MMIDAIAGHLTDVPLVVVLDFPFLFAVQYLRILYQDLELVAVSHHHRHLSVEKVKKITSAQIVGILNNKKTNHFYVECVRVITTPR